METVSLTHPHAARALSPALDAPELDAPALDAPALDAPALDALGDEIASLAAQIHAATYRLLCLIRRFDEAGGWGRAGAQSCAHWLSWRVGVGPAAAREKVRVARALGALPQLSEAFARGEISYSKVRAATRVATPDNEEALLTYARHGTAAQLERIVRHYRGVLRAQAVERDEARQEQRGLRVWVDDEGMVVIAGRLPPEQGAVVLAAIERAEAELVLHREPSPAVDDGDSGRSEASAAAVNATERQTVRAQSSVAAAVVEQPTAAQRRADALALVAQSALAGQLQPGNAADHTQVVLHVDAEALADPEAPGRCAVEGIADVSAETARRLACDASVVPVLHGHDGRVLDVGRKTRSIPPAIRRALQTRDVCCGFPGCDNRRGLQAHHIRHWADGGHTKLHNLLSLCPFHHRLVHEGGFSISRDPETDALCFARPDGQALPAVPAPPVAAAAQPPGAALVAANRTAGLQITANTIACSPHPEPPDYGWAVEILMRADGHLH